MNLTIWKTCFDRAIAEIPPTGNYRRNRWVRARRYYREAMAQSREAA